MRAINYGGGEDTLWLRASEDRNENTGVTHIAHLKTHQGTADKSFVSPIHFTLWRRQGAKVNKPATTGVCSKKQLHIYLYTTSCNSNNNEWFHYWWCKGVKAFPRLPNPVWSLLNKVQQQKPQIPCLMSVGLTNSSGNSESVIITEMSPVSFSSHCSRKYNAASKSFNLISSTD